ncbi:hypothetical protein V500_10154 [Pseudogymnoascus sp. VKM F-4518 (FW-2643)]|nr:hypothetical protein V500_10154 [Pseudogymnoascus sp. VKM F-4518 (FW-2643)]
MARPRARRDGGYTAWLDKTEVYTAWLDDRPDKMGVYTAWTYSTPDMTEDLHRMARRQTWQEFTQADSKARMGYQAGRGYTTFPEVKTYKFEHWKRAGKNGSIWMDKAF